MKKKRKADEVRESFPSREEIRTAQLACCGRCCTQCESPAEYAWRKRDVDMAILLEKAISDELTATERETVTDFWFNGENLTTIAQKKKINPSAVKRTLSRACEKLEKVLKYAVCYQQMQNNENIIPVVLGKARVIAAARNTYGNTTGGRLSGLRKSQNLTCEILASAVGISAERLQRLEEGAEMKGGEVVSISGFYGVTADYILKGELNERN